jgi:hypothetical protein
MMMHSGNTSRKRSMDEARQLATNIAPLPDLLRPRAMTI